MKGKPLGTLVGLILALGLLWFFLFYNKEEGPETENEKVPDIPPPPTTNANSIAGTDPVLLFADTGQGLQAIQSRSKALWKNRQVRSELIRSTSASSLLFQGLSQPSDMEAYFIGVFGSISDLPLTPPVVDGGEFVGRMDSLIDLTDFEQQSQNGLDSAKELYERAGTLSDGTKLYVSDNVGQQVHIGIWGPEVPRRKDRDASQRWDRHADDFKKFAANAANYVSRDLNNALTERATSDLASAGYNFSGYVQA